MTIDQEVQKDVKRTTGVFTGVGVLMILLGAFAVLIPNVASWGMTVLVGWILVIGAAFLFAWSFTAPGALNVIARIAWSILTLAAEHGIKVVEKRITRDEVYIADEAFFTGTAAEVTPIRELDRVQIGIGSRGPITEKIQSAFFDIVNGRNAKYAEWLTPVR